MEPYSIVVSPPNNPEIIKGLYEGLYKVTGGVIRDVYTGRIVAHMREVGDISSICQLSSVSSILPYVNIGIGVLTISAVAISTYYLSKQISKIESKLDKIFDEIRKIRNDTELIKAINLLKDFKKGFEFSEEYIRDERLKKDLSVKRLDTLRNSIATLDIYLDYALTKIFDGKNIEVVLEPMKLLLLAVAWYCKLLAQLGEIDQAYFDYKKYYDKVKYVFFELLKEYFVSDTTEFILNMPELRGIKLDIERLWSYKEEIATIKRLNITVQEWYDLTADKGDGIYLLELREANTVGG